VNFFPLLNTEDISENMGYQTVFQYGTKILWKSMHPINKSLGPYYL